MSRRMLSTLFVAMFALTGPAAGSPAVPPARLYDLDWSIHVDSIPAGTREARIWVAVPQERPEQRVSKLTVNSGAKWKWVKDPEFGNRVVEITVPSPPPSFEVSLSARVERAPVSAPRREALSAKARALYLRQEALVSQSPRIHAIADSLENASRARYDYVLARMDYDKTVPGWGRGDTERACDIGKGNCTDFHSLFMSLSRVADVPVVFEMGYSTVPAGETGTRGGYHCWAWFYDDGARAWVPVDISEADKHPERTEFFYGHLDADRILFSRGRDVRLPGMQGPPLNYLPSGAYAEIDGVPFEGPVTRTISYTVSEP